jgi:hypothetical protein
MRSAGYKVRDKVRGGSRRTAALIHFISREPGLNEPPQFHLRLADTRTGAIVGAATVPLDSTLQAPSARAAASVAALAPNP